MRKRDRDRLAALFLELAERTYQMPVQQLHGASFYFKNNAEIKGFDSAYTALTWLEKHSLEIRRVLRATRRALKAANPTRPAARPRRR